MGSASPQGKILVADNDGVYWLKFIGDVRLTLSAAIDGFFQRLFAKEGFNDLLIDVTEADNLDSTTLGLLAKIGLTAQENIRHKPVIYSTNHDINRLLTSMGMTTVFDIRDQLPGLDTDMGALPESPASEDELQRKVLDAHKVLMGLNQQNKLLFAELVEALEACEHKGC